MRQTGELSNQYIPETVEVSATSVTVKIAVDCFVVSAVAVTVTVYVPFAVGVQITVLLPLLIHPEPDAGLTDSVKSLVFCLVTLSVPASPTFTLIVGVMSISTTTGVVTVKVALDRFVVSAVAVTVTVYVPAAVGVQDTALLPLLAHPEPDAGLTDTVKSLVFCLVTLSVPVLPTLTLSVCVIEIFTVCELLLLLLFPPPPSPPPQAVKNAKNITDAINPVLFRYFIVFLYFLIYKK